MGDFVLPIAIEKWLWISVGRDPENLRCRVWPESTGGDPATLELTNLFPRGGKDEWLNYVTGVLAVLQEEEGFPGITSTGRPPLPDGLRKKTPPPRMFPGQPGLAMAFRTRPRRQPTAPSGQGEVIQDIAA